MSLSRYGRVLALVVAVAGCASAGADDPPVDARRPVDARPPVDAPAAVVDARPPVDAPAPPLDAPPGSLFCANNAGCTVSGECCFSLGGGAGFCTPGSVVLGVCFPN